MMRASRVSYEVSIIHARSAVLFMDALETADRFAVASIPRPAGRTGSTRKASGHDR